MSVHNKITNTERKKMCDLHMDGACVYTIAALLHRSVPVVTAQLRNKGIAAPRKTVARRDERPEWVYARAGYPRYEDVQFKPTKPVGKVGAWAHG